MDQMRRHYDGNVVKPSLFCLVGYAVSGVAVWIDPDAQPHVAIDLATRRDRINTATKLPTLFNTVTVGNTSQRSSCILSNSSIHPEARIKIAKMTSVFASSFSSSLNHRQSMLPQAPPEEELPNIDFGFDDLRDR